MKPGWIIGLASAFVIMQIIAGVCEMGYVGSGEVGLFQQLMQPNIPDVKIPVIGQIAAFFSITWDYIVVLWNMFWFNYPFFQGTWSIVRYIFFVPVSVGVVVSLVLATVRGVSSG